MNPSLPKNLREALNRQKVQGPHPEADLLNAYAERALTAPEDAQITGHLATCSECREVVFLANSAVELPHHVAEPQPERVPMTWWRWAMPATALLVLVVSFVAMKRNAPVEEAQRAVAVNVPQAVPSADSGDRFAAGRVEDKVQAVPKPVVTAEKFVPAPATSANALTKEKREADSAAKDLKKSALGKTLTAETAQPLMIAGRIPVAVRPAEPSRAVGPGSGGGFSGGVLSSYAQNTNAAMGGPSQRANQQVQQKVAANNMSMDAVSTTAAQPRPAAPPPLPVASASETVEVQAEAPVVNEKAGAPGLFAFKSADTEPQAAHRNPISRLAVQIWRITPDGHIERMMKNQWQRALSGVQMAFHAVGIAQDHVWAGGIGPRLFHSSDRGEHWDTIEVKTANSSLNGTVQSIKANDARHVLVLTDSGEAWVTNDGGQSWAKQ